MTALMKTAPVIPEASGARSRKRSFAALAVRDPGSLHRAVVHWPWVPGSKARSHLLRSWARLTSGMTVLLCLAAPALATSGSGSSSCTASLGPVSAVPTVFYDPFDGTSESVTFTVEAVNGGADACTVSLAVESAGSSSTRYFRWGAEKLRYVVETPGGDDYENDIDEPRGSHTIPGGAGKKVVITLKVKVPSGLIAKASPNYENLLKLRLYRKNGPQLGTDKTANATADVERRAQVNIAGASSSWGAWSVDELDFNTLTQGETRSAKVQVRATTGVKIHVDSENDGVLKHKTLPGATVPYELKLNGTVLTLSSGVADLNVSPPVSLEGTSYPMVVTIGDVSGRPAGSYKDLLTVTVSPQ